MIRVERFISKAGRKEAWSDAVTFNGLPFKYDVLSHSANSIRFPKVGVELNLLIDALAPCGDNPDTIDNGRTRKEPTPDFRLSFDGSVVYAECTSAGDSQSFTWQLNVGDWQHRLVRALDERPDVVGRLGKRYVAFVPSRVPSTADIAQLVEEGISFLENENLEALGVRQFGTHVPPKYPALNRIETRIASASSEFPHAFVQMPATSTGGPGEAIAQLYAAFSRKVRQRYLGFRPLWLIIGASQVLWPMEKLVVPFAESLVELSPFERLYVATSRESFRLSNRAR